MVKLIFAACAFGLSAVGLFLAGMRVAESEFAKSKPYGEAWLCGHWVVLRVSQALGAVVSYSEIEELLPIGDDNSFLELKNAFDRIGFESRGLNLKIDEVMQLQPPYVMKLDHPDHFIAVVETNKTGALLFDSAGRRRLETWDQLGSRFSGSVLDVRKNGDYPLPRFRKRTTVGSATIQFEKLLQDIGVEEPENELYRFVFPLRNLGDQTLVLKNVHVNCSCLHVDYPREVQPYGKAEIVVVYSTTASQNRERFHQELTVESNDPDHPFVLLTAQGTVKRRIDSTRRHIDFGFLARGESPEVHTSFLIAGDDPESVNLEISGPIPTYLKVDWIPAADFRASLARGLGKDCWLMQESPNARLRALKIKFDTSSCEPAEPIPRVTYLHVKSNLPESPGVLIRIDAAVEIANDSK